MVINAIVGAYGFTYITIGGFALALYVLVQLHLI